MVHQVLFDKAGNVMGCLPGSAGQSDGEVFYNVFDGSATVCVEAENKRDALSAAKERYKRLIKREK